MNEKVEIISGSWNRIKNWVNKRIRIKANNTFVGENAGKATTGDYNNFIGYQAALANIDGYSNNFMGYGAGRANTSGYGNCFIGNSAGYHNTVANENTFVGYAAGYTNIIGINNLCIGTYAGFYETGSNKLFIDAIGRANEADGRIKALIYGVFAAATANQRVNINARLLIREVPTYANDAAAGTGGLAAGEIYKHADGSLHVKL